MFERYERASRSTGGLGLGLWLVRQLCEAMGGSVRVDSRPGEGATFVVTLPCRTATEGNLT
jgi:signal transduction histidine kinase